MNILFLSVSTAVSNLNNRGIYPDLLREFVFNNHDIYIVCPSERRFKKKTKYFISNNVHILKVETLNITKSNFIEKGIATILIDYQYNRAINKYFNSVKFDLILYATPPISFNSLIQKLKIKHNCKSYLMLKDIFPQNAIDLGLINQGSFLHRYFKRKEKLLYSVSDYIGCMSKANLEYILKNNEINKEKLEICPNSISIINRKADSTKEIFFDKYNIPNDIPVFLFGGNLGLAQGIEFLLKVLTSNKNRKDSYFLIVGSGNKSHLIQNWIDKNNPSNVKLINQLERTEYDILESYCDVGMIFLDSRFTIPNFPSRILSYMECKLPLLIATDKFSDLRKVAVNNGFGIWSVSDDLENFNKNFDFFVKNCKNRKQMGINGYNFLVNNYDVSISYKAITKHFNKFLK